MLEIVQAFDRSPIRALAEDDAAALEAKFVTAKRLFDARKDALEPHERMAILRRVAALLQARRTDFALMIAREGGKPLADALVEVDRAVDGVGTAADCLRSRAGREIPMGLTASSVHRRAWTIPEPIGVVAAISAFNHPLNLVVHQIAPAIAAGCPVIIKPSEATPLSCLAFVELVRDAGMPEGWVQTLITADRALAEALATDARVGFLSFIGSARVGWSLRAKLAPGARCALEHGGAAPVIIDRSADLDRVIPSVVKGGYYHAGQVCVSVQRIYVQADLAAAFVERFAARVAGLKVGDPTLPDTEVGPLIRPAETLRVSQWIEAAVQGGARCLGGGRLNDTTLIPAILLDPSREARISTQEVFGPVTCVYPFTTLDAAIAEANSLPMAFQSSIFTRDLGTALEAAERLDASAVMINDHTAFRTDWMPFAGRHQSGYGVGGIPDTIREMTAEKMIVFNT